nr:hypothetical protein [Paraburkholderia acidipaludis]
MNIGTVDLNAVIRVVGKRIEHVDRVVEAVFENHHPREFEAGYGVARLGSEYLPQDRFQKIEPLCPGMRERF